MKVLITGHRGQLGKALMARSPAGVEIQGADLPEIDIADSAAFTALCAEHSPDLIINAAAYTAVDLAEQEAETAMRVNRDGAGVIANAAADTGARLIHISTDFVFAGQQSSPYTPDDDTGPLGVYGKSKRDGEQLVFERLPERSVVIRTAWLYGHEGANFALSILRLIREKDQLGIVADQVGTPTWTGSLADTVWKFADNSQLSGIYHWSDAGAASWYDFAVAIQEEATALGLIDQPIKIMPIATDEYPTPAQRPAYSVLDKSKTYRDLQVEPVHWRTNLRSMLKLLENES